MDDLIRLLIQNERIISTKNKNLKLTKDEAHYLYKVMRIKIGKEIFITNGQGSLWKAKNLENNFIEINNVSKPYFFQAEDGIRDQPRSRGLGDVYKRQIERESEVPKSTQHLDQRF